MFPLCVKSGQRSGYNSLRHLLVAVLRVRNVPMMTAAAAAYIATLGVEGDSVRGGDPN